MQFGFSMIGDNSIPFFFSFEMACHAFSIGFRMKLCSDHVFIEPDAHYCSFIRNMRTFFLDTKQCPTHFSDQIVVWLDHLVIAAVNRIEWIREAFKNRFCLPVFQHMYREYTE